MESISAGVLFLPIGNRCAELSARLARGLAQAERQLGERPNGRAAKSWREQWAAAAARIRELERALCNDFEVAFHVEMEPLPVDAALDRVVVQGVVERTIARLREAAGAAVAAAFGAAVE
jgi:hypothetical protein